MAQRRATTPSLFPAGSSRCLGYDPSRTERNAVAARAAVWQLLVGLRTVEQKLPRGREDVGWSQVLQLLVVNRLIDPGSDFRLHRQWFDRSAMDVLLGVDFAVAEKDRLYRCLDRILEHRQKLFQHLQQRWKALFDLLLNDLTSKYVEGEADQSQSQAGIQPRWAGRAANGCGFLNKIEALYGQARRVWLMDRGIPTEAVLAEMRASEREIFYLVGTPRWRVAKHEKQWFYLPWHKVRDSVEVKLFSQDGELYVLAKSEGRQGEGDRISDSHSQHKRITYVGELKCRLDLNGSASTRNS
jgi:hypothetical protein